MMRRAWQEWLTPGQYARLFPRGQADLDAFYDRVEEQERVYGIPAECRDFEVYCEIAKIAAEPDEADAPTSRTVPAAVAS